MILRTLLTQLYLVACVAALAVDYYLPQLYLGLLVVLLVWLGLSIVAYRWPAMNRRIGWRGTAPPTPPAFGGTPTGPALGFCLYCAAPLEPGTPVCPACGRTLPWW